MSHPPSTSATSASAVRMTACARRSMLCAYLASVLALPDADVGADLEASPAPAPAPAPASIVWLGSAVLRRRDVLAALRDRDRERDRTSAAVLFAIGYSLGHAVSAAAAAAVASSSTASTTPDPKPKPKLALARSALRVLEGAEASGLRLHLRDHDRDRDRDKRGDRDRDQAQDAAAEAMKELVGDQEGACAWGRGFVEVEVGNIDDDEPAHSGASPGSDSGPGGEDGGQGGTDSGSGLLVPLMPRTLSFRLVALSLLHSLRRLYEALETGAEAEAGPSALVLRLDAVIQRVVLRPLCADLDAAALSVVGRHTRPTGALAGGSGSGESGGGSGDGEGEGEDEADAESRGGTKRPAEHSEYGAAAAFLSSWSSLK